MRNLFLFFVRFNSFFIFLFFEGICLFLIVRSNSYHNASFVNSGNVVTGNIYLAYDNLNSYIHLKAINDSLLRENAHLRTHPIVKYEIPPIEECEPDTTETNTTLTGTALPRYKYIEAKVINNTTDRINNYLTLDRGSRHGIKPEMAVIGANGIIGIVHHVSENFSSVMSVLNKNIKISVKLKHLNYPGNLEWNGSDPYFADLIGIPQYLPINIGDSVITSGYSVIFPEDIPAGIIEEFKKPPGSNFYDIKIKLATNFKTVRYGYVLDYTLKEEQKMLEAEND